MNKIFAASTMTVVYLVIAVIMAAIIVEREMPKGNEMATIEILTALVRGGMSPVGACAMGGNMMAESSMRANNLQNSCQARLGHTDESYTEEVDKRYYLQEQFATDGAGYGLCQWTWPARKRWLYQYADYTKTSIGNEAMQINFCLLEIKTDYSELWNYLHTTTDILEATDRICRKYEQPAVNNIETRYKYAQQMYMDYGAMLEAFAAKGEAGVPGDDPGIPSDTEPPSYIMGTVKPGEHTPEACFLMAQLKRVGYDVLWLGLDACLRDFQQKRGLEVDGVCGEKTWREVMR